MELAQAILDRDADTAERVMTQIINAIPDELKIGM
jgi:DNA-binding FadR family transcriptional regulator